MNDFAELIKKTIEQSREQVIQLFAQEHQCSPEEVVAVYDRYDAAEQTISWVLYRQGGFMRMDYDPDTGQTTTAVG